MKYIPKRPEFQGDFFLAFGLAQRQQEWDAVYSRFVNMSKAVAIEAMKDGARIRHRLFADNEFIYMKGDDILDESHIVLPEFWENRTSPEFDTGWDVVNTEDYA